MATTAGFKQQCPSCEAMVPVRDDSLIGRKIDCPKCKYRFVVEAPAEPEADDEEVLSKSKGSAKKAKGGHDDDDGPRPAKKGNSTTVLVGAGVGGVGVLVLAFGLYFFLFSGSSSPNKSSGGTGGGPASTSSGGSAAVTPPGRTDKAAETIVPTKTADITNLLPNDTRAVVSLFMDKILASSLNKAALLTRGAFNPDDFEQAFGFPLDNVQRLLVGLGDNNDSVFTVLQMVKPYDRQLLQERLNLVAEPPLNGMELFTVKGTFDAFSNLVIKAQRTRDKVQVRYVDAHTLVFADPGTMEKFLLAGGKPKIQSKRSVEPTATPVGAGAGPTDGAKPGMALGKANDDRRGDRRGGPGAGAAPATSGPPATPGGANPGTAPTAVAKDPEIGGSYRTVAPDMKVLLDKIGRHSKQPILYCVAEPQNPLVMDLVHHVQSKLKFGSADQGLGQQLKFLEKPLTQQLKYVGLIVEAFNEDKSTVILTLDTGSEPAGKALEQMLHALVDLVRPALETALGLEFALPANAPSAGPGTVPGYGPRPGQVRPAPAFGGGFGARRREKDKEDRIGFGGGMRLEMPNAQRPGVAPGIAPGTGEAAPVTRPSRVSTALRERTVLVTFDLLYHEDTYEQVLRETEAYMVELRGAAEMVANRSRVHELADVVQAYVNAKGHFPRGTLGRSAGEREERVNDFPPSLRQSWLADLLPFLYGDYKEMPRDNDKPWQEGDNLSSAQILVPQFLCRAPPFYHYYPGVKHPVAVSHFVGIAGVGLDAAAYSVEDRAVAKKLGIFGYDRVTTPKMVKDGLDQTIVALQVPSDAANPWMAGGGSTVRGVSEEPDALEPFVCLEYEGKRGTFAVMADGKVRFVPADLPPNVFRALCTIAGEDKINGLDRLCPEVPRPEGDAQLKTKDRRLPKPEVKKTGSPIGG